jgi:hypothetical protein
MLTFVFPHCCYFYYISRVSVIRFFVFKTSYLQFLNFSSHKFIIIFMIYQKKKLPPRFEAGVFVFNSYQSQIPIPRLQYFEFPGTGGCIAWVKNLDKFIAYIAQGSYGNSFFCARQRIIKYFAWFIGF